MTNEIILKDQLLKFVHELILLAVIKTLNNTWLYDS